MTEPNIDQYADVRAEIVAMTQANTDKIEALAAMGCQVQHNIPMVVLADMLLGNADTGEILRSTGPTPRLFYERRVQEVLAEQLNNAHTQITSQIARQRLLEGVHQAVNGQQILRPGQG